MRSAKIIITGPVAGEPVYMIPFVPYVFVEHYAGEGTIRRLSFDATLNWPDKTRFYGEFFIDDMTAPWSLFSSDWGNKWAFTIGGQYFGAIMNKDISATAEYTPRRALGIHTFLRRRRKV